MSVETLTSVEEYLNTSYDPDVEYVDGVLVERHVGGWLHSLIQADIILALGAKYPNLYAVPGLRSQTKATRYRLPDVCVLLAPPQGRYLLEAAFVAIEILSEGRHDEPHAREARRVPPQGRSPHLGYRSPAEENVRT